MTIYQVVHKQRLHNQEVRNVYYYNTVTGDPSTSEWQDIVDEIRADYVAEVQSALVTDWSFYAIDVREVDVAGLLSFEYIPTAGSVVGTNAVDSLPTQIAILVSVKGTTTKPNRSRTYLAGFNEQAVVDSLVVASSRSKAENLVALQSVLNAAGTNELRRVAAQWNTSHTAVIAFNPLDGATPVASIVPATQRRRRIGVGI